MERWTSFQPSKQTVPVVCPDVSQLEDRLANGIRMRLVSLADANPLGQGRHSERGRRTHRILHPSPVSRRTDCVRERRRDLRADLGDAAANQSRFFDEDYSESLKSMALAVIETQRPIRDDALAREVARSHGFARTGHRIKEQVLALLPNVTTTLELVGTFWWHGPSSPPSAPYRFHSTDGDRRSLDEIAMPELIGLVREFSGLDTSNDPALALAREIGLARLSRSSRERLEEAIEASRSVTSTPKTDWTRDGRVTGIGNDDAVGPWP